MRAIEAVLRRAAGDGDKEKPRRLVFDKLIIDLDSFELIVDGKRVETPPKEMELLYHLAVHTEPRLHAQPAARRGLGLRLFRRQPHRRRPRQAPARKARGRERPVEPENRLGRRV